MNGMLVGPDCRIASRFARASVPSLPRLGALPGSNLQRTPVVLSETKS
jgi:hypothetical protein